MNSLKIWIAAARFRTLPLSVSGIIVGNALALNSNDFSYLIFTLSLLTAILFQVISNFANDFGDGVKGTDNENRVGPKRVLQQGLLTPLQLKKGIILLSLVSLGVALSLILIAFGLQAMGYIIIFILLAIAAVLAAIKYTVGKNAYGYRGLGDLFVFVFFGLVSVGGSYFLQTKDITLDVLLLGVAIGLLSVGVLNLNNMRDRKNDEAVGKNTLVVLMGSRPAKFYHAFLILLPVFLIIYSFADNSLGFGMLPFLAFIPLFIHFMRVMLQINPEHLDPELKRLALSVFFFAILVLVAQFLL